MLIMPKKLEVLSSEPIMFMKPTSSLSGPNDDVMLPKGLVLGKNLRN